MLCGPYAAARASGLEVATLVARIKYLREQRGVRTSLRGGTTSTDLREALALEGYRMRRVFWNRRVRLATLAQRITRGAWVFRQHGHFFGVESGRHLRALAKQYPNARPVTHGWLVHRQRQ